MDFESMCCWHVFVGVMDTEKKRDVCLWDVTCDLLANTEFWNFSMTNYLVDLSSVGDELMKGNKGGGIVKVEVERLRPSTGSPRDGLLDMLSADGTYKEVFPVPHGFQCFSSGIPVESSGLPLEVHWKSTGHLNSHKPNKFIRLSSKSPLDFHWTSTGSPLDSTIFHWTFVPVLFQWTPVDSSGIPVESSGIPVEFTGICSTVFK